MTSRPHVVMGFGDALAAVETAWSLIDAGYSVTAVVRTGSRPPLRHVPGVVLHDVVSPRVDADAAVAQVSEVIRRERPVTFLPLDDEMVWICGRLGRCGVEPLLTLDQVDLALDKRKQLTLARAAGLPCPETAVVETDDDWRGVDHLDVIVKPALAAEVEDGRLVRQTPVRCQTTAELSAARVTLRPPLLVQPVITGTGEGVFGLATGEEVVGWSAHRRVRMMNPSGSGASACISTEVDPDLRAAVARFVASAGWRGMFMVEILRDARGVPWFMELNGRAWGSMALARRRGFAYPPWTVQVASGAPLDPEPPVSPPHLTCRHIGRELIHLGFVVRASLQGGRDPSWPSPFRTIGDLLAVGPDVELYNMRRGQMTVWVSDTVQSVAGQVRKGVERR